LEIGAAASFGKDEKAQVIKEYVAFDPLAQGGENAVCSGKDH
jgi:hypothetical protein